MNNLLKAALAIALLLLIGWLGSCLYNRSVAEEAEKRENVAMSEVVTATFSSNPSLSLSALSGTVKATATDDGFGGWLPSDTVMTALYKVRYFIDLKGLGTDDVIWNSKEKRLVIRVPDVRVDEPSIDGQHVQMRRRGVWITREVMDKMGRQANVAAVRVASQKAQSPEYMMRAREEARKTLQNLFRIPLASVGRGDVRIEVRFPFDANQSDQVWDESRSLEAVLADM